MSIQELARDHGIDLAKEAGRQFAAWLAERPRIAKRPALVKLLRILAGA